MTHKASCKNMLQEAFSLSVNHIHSMPRYMRSDIHHFLCFSLFMLLFCGCENKSSEESNPSETKDIQIDSLLTQRIDSCVQRLTPKHKTAVYVYDLTADKPVYGYHEKDTMPTASCMKLVTGIAALHLLGSDYTFDTKIYAKGTLKEGTFKGIITLKGELDPQLNAYDLQMFPKKLKEIGIKKIEGALNIDLTLHEKVTAEEHWYPWDLTLGKYGIFFHGPEKVMKQTKACFRNTDIAVADSSIHLAETPAGSKCIFRYRRSINLIINKMWKNSSNTQSTGLLYNIGHHVDPHANPSTSGVAYLKSFMKDKVGCLDTTYCIHDGCGLCTYNRLSPVHLVQLLKFGYQDRTIYQHLNKYLPRSGVDGTLAYEMREPLLRGKIRAKTGTLSHPYGISTLSGYCEGRNGHTLAFSIMNSQMSVLDARVIQRKLCKSFVK